MSGGEGEAELTEARKGSAAGPTSPGTVAASRWELGQAFVAVAFLVSNAGEFSVYKGNDTELSNTCNFFQENSELGIWMNNETQNPPPIDDVDEKKLHLRLPEM